MKNELLFRKQNTSNGQEPQILRVWYIKHVGMRTRWKITSGKYKT